MRTQLIAWLGSQQTVIETLICNSAEEFGRGRHIDKPSSNFLFDLKASEEEALALSRGGDLCYDRYTTGMSYALWYQGRRINTALTFCLDFVEDAIQNNKPIEIFDLGAGTGAVQIAIGLCLEGVRVLGYDLPKTRIINVDISPFMMDYNRSFLWREFRKKYEGCRAIQAEYLVNSWTNPEDIQLETPFFVASYLFDHTENRDDIAQSFKELVEKYQPTKFVLLTSNQPQKRKYLDSVVSKIAANDYEFRTVDSDFIFTGPMTVVGQYRQSFNRTYEAVFSTYLPKWNERSFYAKLLQLRQVKLTLQLLGYEPPVTTAEINLYMPPIKVRREIHLNQQQQDAARLTKRPTVITGPAGCGKSVVITERIKNLCQASQYNQNLRILLTTFNKDLMRYLGDWLNDVLDSGNIRKCQNDFFFQDSPIPNIRLLHFDVLPTRIGEIRGDLRFDQDQKKYIREAIQTVRMQNAVEPTYHTDILEEDFLYDEYIRVIYGQQYDTLEAYQTGERKSRPFNLQHNSERRELIWKTVRYYLNYLEEEEKASIHSRRHKFLRQLKDGEHQSIFTHVFVDEFQDCTQADYQIFYGLLSDNNQLVIAGDYAQAIHLGKTAAVPREDEIFRGATAMGNRLNIQLEGSYRLPFRISECIKPLSQFLQRNGQDDLNIITPYKGAPPGARPIVVYGKDTEEMKTKLLWIFWYFQIFDLFDSNLPRRKKITILERDGALCRSLNDRLSQIATTSTILRLKGMEKDCIVWSTRSEIDDVDDVFYYIYTILTRTCSILIIALFPEVPTYVYEALSKMESSRLMLWDQESKEIFEREIKRFESTQEVLDLQVDE